MLMDIGAAHTARILSVLPVQQRNHGTATLKMTAFPQLDTGVLMFAQHAVLTVPAHNALHVAQHK
jgi:hypothetical protein